MSTITVGDGTTIYYKDWGTGPVVTLSHGWSLKSDAWDGFTEDLRRFDVPTLVMHGEDDQIVPVKESAKKSAKLIRGAREIYYPGIPHGLTATHQDKVNSDLLKFLRSLQPK
jgi:non-heme chloroperoxidase